MTLLAPGRLLLAPPWALVLRWEVFFLPVGLPLFARLALAPLALVLPALFPQLALPALVLVRIAFGLLVCGSLREPFFAADLRCTLVALGSLGVVYIPAVAVCAMSAIASPEEFAGSALLAAPLGARPQNKGLAPHVLA